MGWTYTRRPQHVSVTNFIQNRVLTWTPTALEAPVYRVLAIELVGEAEIYAAVETTQHNGDRKVWAAVVIIDQLDDGEHNLGYKDLEESMLPYYYNCPKHILDMLTETDDPQANEWRTKCRETIDRQPALFA